MTKKVISSRKEKWQFLAEKLGEKLFDLANIVAGTMIFGQFISDRPFNLVVATIGALLLILLYGWSILLLMKFAR